MEAFFIVRLFGCNSADLMNMSARAAPEVEGVSEGGGRGEEGEEEGEESFITHTDHLTAVRY